MIDDVEHRQNDFGNDVGNDARIVASDKDGQWLPLGVVARLLGISRSSVYGRVRRGTLAARPLGNRGLEVLVPTVARNVAGDDVSDDHGDDADDIAATLRKELEAARVTIGRLEERLVAAGELRTAVEAKAAVEAAAMRAQLEREIARADRFEAALLEAKKPWLARVLEGLRRKGS